MAYSFYNPNPAGRSIGDCAIRAVAKATGQDWEAAYVGLSLEGMSRGDLPNADSVWGAYLRKHGFRRYLLSDEVPDGYTVEDFANDNPAGVFVLSMPGRHVLTVQNGEYFDSWDSGREVPVYYWAKD